MQLPTDPHIEEQIVSLHKNTMMPAIIKQHLIKSNMYQYDMSKRNLDTSICNTASEISKIVDNHQRRSLGLYQQSWSNVQQTLRNLPSEFEYIPIINGQDVLQQSPSNFMLVLVNKVMIEKTCRGLLDVIGFDAIHKLIKDRVEGAIPIMACTAMDEHVIHLFHLYAFPLMLMQIISFQCSKR